MRQRYRPYSLVPGSRIILFVLLAFNSCRNHQEIEETSEKSVVDLVEPNLMFGPSLTCETSVVCTARYCQVLWLLLTSPCATREPGDLPR